MAKIIFLQESRFYVAVAREIIQDAPVAVAPAVIPAKAGIQEGRHRDTGQFRLFTGSRPDGEGSKRIPATFL